MKPLLRILFFITPLTSFTQLKSVNFSHVDDRVLSIPVNRVDSLAKHLTFPYTTDLEKVRSIFRWITENIEYQAQPYYTYLRNSRINYWEEDPTDTGALKPLDERVAELVLKRRLALCDGYSRLFKTLCDYAGIRAETILGYARVGRGRFQSNHRWNAVMIDSSWYLLDATWASGFITYTSNVFVKHLDEQYFLAPPEEFVRHHYPEDLKWTLLKQPPLLREFHSSPFKHQSFTRHNISAYKPQSGIIEAKVGDTINFEVETNDVDRKLWVADSAFLDSATIAGSGWVTTHLSPLNDKKARCSYIVSSDKVEWLHIILNNEAILRYKLNVRKDLTASN